MERKCLDDNVIIRDYLHGNKRAFSLLVAKYHHKVFSTIYLIVRNPTETEDLVQDCFQKVYMILKSGKYREEGRFAPWLIRIARNKAVDHYRKIKNRPETKLDNNPDWTEYIPLAEESHEDKQIEKEKHQQVRTWIQKLPANQQEVVYMRSYKSMSYSDIAYETGSSVNTALVRMRYAIKSLRKSAIQEGFI